MRALLDALTKVLSLLPEWWAFSRARWVLSEEHAATKRLHSLQDEIEALRHSGDERDAQYADLLRRKAKLEQDYLKRLSTLHPDAASGNGGNDGAGAVSSANP